MDSNWIINKAWSEENGYEIFQATSRTIAAKCRNTPDGFIQFPMVIHSVHEIFADGVKIQTFGDPTFERIRSFYGAPYLKCSQIRASAEVTWRVATPSHYFARLSHFPYITSGPPRHNVISESLNLIAAGSLLLMSIFVFVVFAGKVGYQLTLSISLANLFLSFYFVGTVAELLGIRGSLLVMDKIADGSLWIGMALFMNALRMHGVLNKRAFQVWLTAIGTGLVFIMLSSDVDEVQVGTSLPFGLGLAVLFWGVIKFGRPIILGAFEKRFFFLFLSLVMFSFVCLNDVLVVSGVTNGYMILPIGVVWGMLFFALSVNEQINAIYRERDYLRANLQVEVRKKTEELSKKTLALEAAMDDLKKTQAELVQSAKLASLGTLSAGIAHEINNSLNYVYGSLKPIEKMVQALPDAERREKILSLTHIMHDGLRLTFDIIKSLRNFTGLNQAKFNDIRLSEVIDSVLTILRSKLDKFQVKCEVASEIKVFGSVVGLNQVFMNLISNALDAMPSGGTLQISARAGGERVLIDISDTGTGIPQEIKDRIFEPFFTTKDVGRGTGLGLHMVKMEIDRHHGTIKVASEPGKGSTFHIELPQRDAGLEKVAA